MSNWLIKLTKSTMKVATDVCCLETGVSANADPHTKKLRTRVTHIWGYRRRQPNRSAMEGPPPGRTAWLITVSSVPGKYDLRNIELLYELMRYFFVTVYIAVNQSLD